MCRLWGTRALLDSRQARYAQRLMARLAGCDGPEEILGRRGSTLRYAAQGETVESQEWPKARAFRSSVVI